MSLLVFGTVFLVLGVLGLAGTGPSGAWISASLLAAAGAAGLVGAIRTIMR